MRRRTLILLCFGSRGLADAETPRNKMGRLWNELQIAQKDWAAEVNRMAAGTLSVIEAAAFDSIENLYQQWRSARNRWIRGNQ